MLKEYVVMKDGIIVQDILVAETLDDAQVLALQLHGNTPNVIAMTVGYAKEKYSSQVKWM